MKVMIDTEEFTKETSSQFNGVQIKIAPSPYDLPESISYIYNPADDCLKITFEYIDNEPLTSKPLNAFLQILLGQHTKKVAGFVLSDIKKMGIGKIQLELEEKTSDLTTKLAMQNSRMASHYEIIRKLMNQNREHLIAATA